MTTMRDLLLSIESQCGKSFVADSTLWDREVVIEKDGVQYPVHPIVNLDNATICITEA